MRRRGLAAVQEPDDQPDQAGKHQNRRAEDQPEPDAAFEGGNVASDGCLRLAAEGTADGIQVTANFRRIIQANISENRCHITGDGSLTFDDYISAHGGYVAGHLARDIDRTADRQLPDRGRYECRGQTGCIRDPR
jgi:hypothetical protein